MTAAELRARAKELRAEARKLTKEAEGLEFADTLRETRQRSAQALEERAKEYARPVWVSDSERRGGPWCVLAVEHGRILIGTPPPPGQLLRGDEYLIRNGQHSLVGHANYSEQVRASGILDVNKTLEAWREFCAERKKNP